MDIDASLVAHAGQKAAEQGVQSLLQFRYKEKLLRFPSVANL